MSRCKALVTIGLVALALLVVSGAAVAWMPEGDEAIVAAELLPIEDALRDIQVLLESAAPANDEAAKLANEVRAGLVDLENVIEELCTQIRDKKLDTDGVKAAAASSKERFAPLEAGWRQRATALLGRDDLPQVPAPAISPDQRNALYAGYLKLCADASARARAEGARGLGALGERKAIPVLLQMINDDEEDVRVSASTSLAWLRAREAVPELTKLLEEDRSRWVRRRAAQALGQIGDTSAIPDLMRHVRDTDVYLAENAILSLGWLRAEEAIPELSEIVKEGKDSSPTFNWRQMVMPGACAAVALGYIGGAEAKEALLEPFREFVGKTASGDEKRKEWWRRFGFWTNAGFAVGLTGDAEAAAYVGKHFGSASYWGGTMAIPNYVKEMVEANRRDELTGPGIAQPDFTSQPEFYDFGREKFLRVMCGYQQIGPVPTMPLMYRQAWATGANVFRFIEQRQGTNSWLEMRRRIEYLQRIGLKTQMLLDFNGGGHGKAGFTRLVALYGDLPGWQGIEQEELEFSLTRSLPVSDAFEGPEKEDFRKRIADYLKSKYTQEQLRELEIDPDAVAMPNLKEEPQQRYDQRVLLTELNDLRDEGYLEFYKEFVQFAHMLRRGTTCHYSFSIIYANSYPSGYLRLGDVCDGCGPENARHANTFPSTFFTELCRNGEPRSSYVFRWPGFVANEPAMEQDMASYLTHGQGYLFWGWSYYWYRPLYRRTPRQLSLCEWKFDTIKTGGRLAQRLEPYLLRTRIATPVAQLFSERTGRSVFYLHPSVYGDYASRDREYLYSKASGYLEWFYSYPSGGRYSRDQAYLYQTFIQAHTAVEPLIVETLSKEKLAPYQVLILANARTLTPDQEELLRTFVRDGGTLVASGSSTLYDQWGRRRPNYGLSDVFGVDFRRDAQAPEEQAVWGGLRENDRGRIVPPPLDMKITLAETSKLLKRDWPGEAVYGYASDCGHDGVKETVGEVIGRFENGDPAVVLSRYGEGRCVFLAGQYLGYAGDGPFWRALLQLMLPETEPGLLVETVLDEEAISEQALADMAQVEIVPRLQPHSGRMIIHLLNRSQNNVPGIRIRLHLPEAEGKQVKLFYATDGQPAEWQRREGAIQLSVRELAVYDIIVVEQLEE